MKKLTISKNLFAILVSDIILLSISYISAYYLRYEAILGKWEQNIIKQTIVPVVLCKLIVFYLFNLYRGMWRYTSIVDMLNVVKAIVVSSSIIVSVILMISRFHGFSRSVFIIDAMFTLIFISGIRLMIRMFLSKSIPAVSTLKSKIKNKKEKRIIIIGAGYAGEKVAREINDNPDMCYKIVGFVDDDLKKSGKHIHGNKVLGRIENIKEISKKMKVDELLIAIPSAPGKKIREIVEICKSTEIPFKTLINGNVSIKRIRDISYKDLLRRPHVHLENLKIADFLKNKCIMITGAGGSIGSELCRQVCRYLPSLIILFDSSEANLYSIEMELKHNIPDVKHVAILGRVQDELLVDRVISKYKPDVIFHAAAYKHVPLVERNPWEAIFTNIVGTNTIVKAAIKHQIKRFVLVSTDKAVRPTNVMGASKRVTEKIIHSQQSGMTKFMAVRFGNVIGSSGSVIPLFRQQIEKGGPVTITHPEITRFFMTIEEAALLILQAFTMGEGGEIFILEMGTPVKIVDIAKDLIRLSGKENDIDIIFTGLRPGEKLYEELITVGEGIVKTTHEKILVLKNGNLNSNEIENKKNSVKEENIDSIIKELIEIANKHDPRKIKCKLKEIVPEFTMSEDDCVI